MNFSTYSFWWNCLLFFVVFWVIRHFSISWGKWHPILDKIGLVFASLFLFFNAAKSSFFIFIAEIIFNYISVKWMIQSKGNKRKLIAIFIIILDISVLIAFKYFDFLVQEMLYPLFSTMEFQSEKIQGFSSDLSIPPGISFYTFQMLAFVIDSYKKEDNRKTTFLDYLNFTAFFPQLVAGPIERKENLLPQIKNFKFKISVKNIDSGLRYISLGLFMKLVLADTIAPFINLETYTNAWSIWLSIYLFGLRIYFDFAGYSLIAIGLGIILGIQLQTNFRAPYLSITVQEFWQRWHITLSSWLRDYIYIPLGGSRKSHTGLNVLIVFAVSGLWHGAGWNFIVWGIYHGLLIILFPRKSIPNVFCTYFPSRIGSFLAWLVTLNMVMLGWLFFMESRITFIGLKLTTLLNPLAYSMGNLKYASTHIANSNLQIASLITVLFLSFSLLVLEYFETQQKFNSKTDSFLKLRIAPFLLVMTISLAAKSSSNFIYFSF